MRLNLSKKAVGAIATAGVLAATAVTAVSAGPATIKACVNQQTFAVRILPQNQPCAVGEETVSWNVQGPPGPAGSPGIAGMVAAYGATADSSAPFQELTVLCPAGKVAINGGGEAVTGPWDSLKVALNKSEPVYNGAARPVGWSLRMVQLQSFDTPWHAQLYVNCAYVQS